MIKKLQAKFTALAIISVLAVLVLMICAINMVNYQKVVANADSLLTIIADNNGVFPDKTPKSQNMKPINQGSQVTPETRFEARFFTVTINDNGKMDSTNIDKIASVDSSEAISYARKASKHSAESGFIKNFRYKKVQIHNGTRYIFLDCTRSMDNFHAFLYSCIAISTIGFIFIALVIFYISKIIVKPATESYDKQRRFITDAGHELKTPLTIIDADVSVAEMENDDNEWLNDIKVQTNRLAELTGALVYLSKMEESERTASTMLDFPFSELISETAKSFEARAKVDNKTFSYDVEPMLTLRGDEGSIRKLTSILLDNAFKYSDDHGRIRLSADRKGKFIRLAVYNTAPSIQATDLPHLFDRFFRADESRNSETGGYGIGLSVAQAIVIKHKGKINASTDDGKSLLITASFPV